MIIGSDGKVLFDRSELACKCCGQVRLMEPFTNQLKRLRELLQRPMVVNSCCRCEAHNKQIQGHPRSLHMFTIERGTCAIDIHCPDDAYRHRLMKIALDEGMSVGVYKTFCHIDMRTLIGKKNKSFWGKY